MTGQLDSTSYFCLAKIIIIDDQDNLIFLKENKIFREKIKLNFINIIEKFFTFI